MIKLLDYFCPTCVEQLLTIDDSDGKQVYACASCGSNYPVIDGIPRFVTTDEYVGNFSFEWNIHRKTQIDNEQRKTSEDAFFLRFGQSPQFFKDKRVLDVGIGAGRYADVALRAGAELWGIDLSFSVATAKENLARYGDKIHLAQADLFNPPFAPESFDVIYSFGVLHHTPDPKKGFDGLVKLLKPGGVICITTYTNYGMYFTSQFARRLTSKLSPFILYPLTTLFTLAFYLPYKYLGMRHGVMGRLLPISLSDSLSEAILDTYDCYSPKYQFCYAVHEVFDWFRQNGLEKVDARPHPTTVLGYKPLNKIDLNR
jgi:SAM-dependent methyltransferase